MIGRIFPKKNYVVQEPSALSFRAFLVDLLRISAVEKLQENSYVIRNLISFNKRN